MTNSHETAQFGRLLKFWREVHQLSQEALALELSSSTRHLSCLENNKARPSLSMVKTIATRFNLNERDTSHLMLAAGFVPENPARDLTDPSLRWLRNAMELNLNALMPQPAVLIDRYGDVQMANEAWFAVMHEAGVLNAENSQPNYYVLLFKLLEVENDEELRQNTASLIRMALQQEYLLSGDAHFEAVLKQLDEINLLSSSWPTRAARLDPMASYRIPVKRNGQIEHVFNVNQSVGAPGPASYVSEPRLTLCARYPESKNSQTTS